MFDPWSSTFEQADAEQEKWLADNKELSSPHSPFAQMVGALEIMKLKEQIEAGDGFSVLLAIRYCVTTGLIAPDWLAYAFADRFDMVNQLRAKSWDDPLAFGRPYPKGTNLAARKKAKIGRLKVLDAVSTIVKSHPDTPIDKELFTKVGEPLGFGATLTEEYYYEAKKIYGYDPKDLLNRKPRKNQKICGNT